jgi:cytochrome c peroxidase
MRVNFYLFLIIVSVLSFWSFHRLELQNDVEWLREVYSKSPSTKWPKPHLDFSINLNTFEDIGILPPVTHPENNPYSAEKAELGKMLFFDPRLSVSCQISCANCHNPELAWTDNITRSFGHDRQTGARNAMTILNVAYAKSLFWDGRASSLEEQAKFPIQDPLEMNLHLNLAVDRIADIPGYQKIFQKVFPNEPIKMELIQKAIATFERTIVSPPSRFDQFISGNSEVFTNQEVIGLHLFRTKARCINCHNTPYFSDNLFHNDGQTLIGTKNEDLGRYYFTKDPSDKGKFKTPTLREVGRTGPWMHHGHFPTLLDVVQFYNLGNPSPIQKKYQENLKKEDIPVNSPLLKKLELTKEEELALVAFLQTLSTPTRRMKAPDLPN